MDRLIYTAMTGANAAQYRQQLLANNLANASTPGFRAELATFRAVPVRGDGASTRVFALEATAGHSDAPGAVTQTGRNLDVAAKGNAYFAVQALDGTEAYTRAGALEVNTEGTLVNAAGLAMLGDKLPAAEAKAWGLIWDVAPEGQDVAGAALALAQRLAVMPTKALVATRQVLRAACSNDLDAQLDLERDTQSALGRTDDYIEGVTAFLQKRPPQFKGA